MQYYVPAYLLKGNPQPVISSVSTTKLTYNKAFTVAYTLKNDTLKRCGFPACPRPSLCLRHCVHMLYMSYTQRTPWEDDVYGLTDRFFPGRARCAEAQGPTLLLCLNTALMHKNTSHSCKL